MKYYLVLLSLLLVACDPYLYRADLVQPQREEFNQACQTVVTELYQDDDDDEVMAVKFKGSFDFIDLVPQGKSMSDHPVGWLNQSEDGLVTYAFLSQPSKLKTGEIKKYVGKQVCVTFNPDLFDGREFELEQYRALSGAECCGLLQREIKK